jgi:polysaccharide pyruvyl transferase WcaK-like protein
MQPLPILGYYGHNNAGDEAFKLAFSQNLDDHPHEFRSRISADESFPLALVGGGAIINSYFLRNLATVNAVHLIGCSLPQSDRDVLHLEPIRHKIRQMVLRSRRDVEAVRRAGYDATFIPDMVFAVRPSAAMTLQQLIACAALPPRDFDSGRRKLVVFVSGDYWVDPIGGDKTKFQQIEILKIRLAKALDQLAGRYDIVMPSMSVWYNARDYHFACDVLKRMGNRHRVCVIERYVDAQDLISALASEDCTVLSMKYHGLVFGLLSNRPVINIGTTRKTVDLMQDFGIPEMTFKSKGGHSDHLVNLVEKTEEPALRLKVAKTSAEWRHEAAQALKAAVDAVAAEARAVG